MKTSIFILLFFSISVFVQAQSKIVNGTVSDEQGNVLPGVTVLVENGTRGTVTDHKGFYQIEVLPNDSYLIFSFIGYKTEKIKIGTKNNINVVLKTELVTLNEEVKLVECEDAVVISAPSLFGKKSSMARGIHVGGVMPPSDRNTENYSTIHENGFKSVLNNPLSTFSIDVDNASYSNVRRFLNQGDRPPVDAVRVEEMINYFSYNYPEPMGEHPFSVYTELSECPWNSSHQLLHIGLKGKSIDKTELPASNLVFLLDVSGSMDAYNKLPLVKKAFRLLVNELRPNDRIAIVVYAGAAGKVLDSTPGNKKGEILEAIERLQAGGSTAGGEGLKLAYKIAKENFIKGGNNRIILATDGDFNVGVSSTSEMERLVENERENGIFMTVLGFGTGNIKDDKMETIADKGNGNYAYIDNIHEARKVLINEFGGTLFTIAKDVK
ncbi:MAG: von Willebrand factor type A domain-containing protein, partial [Prolixibacteraceae bacterium]|nr:von Willebrand factor type A domain-containing protein [Prolixibacteraceae bacterium]